MFHTGNRQRTALQKQRAAREARWKDLEALEKDIVQPYLHQAEHLSNSNLEGLDRHLQRVLSTNTMLQQQLEELDHEVAELRHLHAAKQESWNQLQLQLSSEKTRYQEAKDRVRELHSQRFAEESRLRDKDLVLHRRIAALTRENTRLKEQRCAESQAIAHNLEHLQELDLQIAELKKKKQEFEDDETEDMDTVLSSTQ